MIRLNSFVHAPRYVADLDMIVSIIFSCFLLFPISLRLLSDMEDDDEYTNAISASMKSESGRSGKAAVEEE